MQVSSRSARWVLGVALALGLLPVTALTVPAGAGPAPVAAAPAAALATETTVLTGSLTGADAQQAGRLQRDGQVHGCELPATPMPPLENNTVLRRDSHQLSNPHDEARCVIVEADFTQCDGHQTQVSAYSSFNPALPANNVLGATGFSSIAKLSFGFRVAANSSYTIVLNEVEPGELCSSYRVEVTNAPMAAVTNHVEGPGPAAITTQVNGFRSALGPVENRREITWDEVPESAADPGFLPADYYNSVEPRGLVFTAGSKAKVSSDGSGATPAEFGGLDPNNAAQYQPFSGVRIMATEPNIADIAFRVAGTGTPAPTSAFAAVLVNPGTAGFLLPRGADGKPIGIYVPPAEENGLGFYGIRYNTPEIWSMSLTGDLQRGADDGTAFDNVIFADPGIGLSVTTTGPGQVTGPGITCPGDCTQKYAPGSVTLTAVPDGLAGVRWGGACAAAGTVKTCVVPVSQAQAVSADFTSCQKQGSRVKKLKKAVKKKRSAVLKAKKALSKADGPAEVAAAKSALTKAHKALKKAQKKLKNAKKKLKACLG